MLGLVSTRQGVAPRCLESSPNCKLQKGSRETGCKPAPRPPLWTLKLHQYDAELQKEGCFLGSLFLRIR